MNGLMRRSKLGRYSITSSARAGRVSMTSTSAVLRLMASVSGRLLDRDIVGAAPPTFQQARSSWNASLTRMTAGLGKASRFLLLVDFAVDVSQWRSWDVGYGGADRGRGHSRSHWRRCRRGAGWITEVAGRVDPGHERVVEPVVVVAGFGLVGLIFRFASNPPQF
jgi:hypothetical protein